MEPDDTNARLRAQVAALELRLDRAELIAEAALFILRHLREGEVLAVDAEAGAVRLMVMQ